MGMKVDVVPVGRTTKPLDVFPMVCNQPKDPNSPPGTTDKNQPTPFFTRARSKSGVFSKFRQTGVFFLWGLDVIGSLLKFQ